MNLAQWIRRMANVTKLKKSIEELETELQVQLQLLTGACDRFDQGSEIEIRPISSIVRTLVHDTGNSHSLLKQLNTKEQSFYDSSMAYDDAMLGSHEGIVIIINKENDYKFVAGLDSTPESRRVPFDDWWMKEVIVNVNKERISRKKLILTRANKLGGSHVHRYILQEHKKFAAGFSSGLRKIIKDQELPLDDIEKASIRQIGHEILKTLLPEYEKTKDYGADLTVASMQLFKGRDNIERYLKNQGIELDNKSNQGRKKEMRRNEECICGSGKRWKHCHGKKN